MPVDQLRSRPSPNLPSAKRSKPDRLAKPTTFFIREEETSPKWAKAFAAGCQGAVSTDLSVRTGAVAAFGTPPMWPLLDSARDDGRDYYYGDHGYWRRGKYFRITRNHEQYQPTATDLRSATPHRLELMHVNLAPEWKRDGSSIVICPNSHIYMAHRGTDAEQWIADVVAKLVKVTTRPIIVRWKKTAKERPIYVDLDQAWMVIAFSSASAIDALTAGVPICTVAPWATTASMGITSLDDIERPRYPDERLPFLWALAHRQWTLPEMASGLAWRTFNADVA